MIPILTATPTRPVPSVFRRPSACRYVVGTVPGLPLADGVADLVYTGKGALTWTPDIGTWARDATRLLRPGGHLFVYEEYPAVPLWTWSEDEPGIRGDRS